MTSYLSSVLTIAVGALPASVLAIWAIFLGIIGSAAAVDGIYTLSPLDVVIGIAFVAWSLIALWGTYGLWAAAILPKPISSITAASLVGGISAMLLAILLFGDWTTFTAPPWFVMFPIIVAVWHLFQWRRAI